jgi:hypothetical protein
MYEVLTHCLWPVAVIPLHESQPTHSKYTHRVSLREMLSTVKLSSSSGVLVWAGSSSNDSSAPVIPAMKPPGYLTSMGFSHKPAALEFPPTPNLALVRTVVARDPSPQVSVGPRKSAIPSNLLPVPPLCSSCACAREPVPSQLGYTTRFRETKSGSSLCMWPTTLSTSSATPSTWPSH